MSRALPLALALLPCLASAAADQRRQPKAEKRPPRPALTAAACHENSPVLLVRQKAGPESPAPEASVGGATELPRDEKSCADTLAGLPDDAELAMRPPQDPDNPDEPLTPEAVEKAFKAPTRVDKLSGYLDRQAAALGVKSFEARKLDAFFDNSAAQGVTPDQRAALTATMIHAVRGTVTMDDPALRRISPPVVKEKGFRSREIPPWYDQSLGPTNAPATSRMSQPRYNDGGHAWLPPSRTGPPAGTTFPPNFQGTPSGRFQNPTQQDSRAPVWEPFYTRFKQCAPDCEPYNFGIWRAGSMCHSSGHAIDVHAMKCADGIHTALQNGKYAQLVQCMRQKGMFAIWQQCFINCGSFNATSYHYDHAHFSIGCGWGRK